MRTKVSINVGERVNRIVLLAVWFSVSWLIEGALTLALQRPLAVRWESGFWAVWPEIIWIAAVLNPVILVVGLAVAVAGGICYRMPAVPIALALSGMSL